MSESIKELEKKSLFMNESITLLLDQLQTDQIQKHKISEIVDPLRSLLKDLDNNFGFLPEELPFTNSTRKLLACVLKIISKKSKEQDYQKENDELSGCLDDYKLDHTRFFRAAKKYLSQPNSPSLDSDLMSISELDEGLVQPRHRRSIQRPMQTVRHEKSKSKYEKPKSKDNESFPEALDERCKSTPYLSQNPKGLRRVSAAQIPKPMEKTKSVTPIKQVSLALPATPHSCPASNPNKVLLRSQSSQKQPIVKSSHLVPRKNPLSPKSPKSPTSPSKKQGKHLSEKGEAEMEAILAMLAAEV